MTPTPRPGPVVGPAHSPGRQRGAALLIALLLVTLALTSILVSGLSQIDLETQRQKKTLVALAQAKEALIAWSVLHGDTGDRPGTLPCPDTNFFGSTSSGNESGSCSAAGGTSLGRLPWKSLGIGELRDADGEPLWYAVSDRFRRQGLNNAAINSDTPGTLLLYAEDGTTLLTGSGDELAAIVFSPGKPLPGQDRVGAPNSASSYLDSGNGRTNAAAGGPFIAGPAKDAAGNEVINDRVLGISARELIAAVEKRALREAENALAAYATDSGGKYPNPGDATGPNCVLPITDINSAGLCASNAATCVGRLPEDALSPYVATWFRKNGWGRVTLYAVSKTSVVDGSGASCPALLTVDGQPKQYVIIAPGTPGPHQSRPSSSLGDYLDDPANSDAWNPDARFVRPGGASNDQLRSYP